MNMYCTELDAEKSLSFQLATGRQAYMLCIEGTVTVKHNGDGGAVMMVGGDSMEVRGEHGLTVHAGEKGAHCLIVEMKKV